MDRFAILQRDDSEDIGFALFFQLDAVPEADAAVRLRFACQRIGECGSNPFAAQVGALAEDLFFEIAGRFQPASPSVTKLSITRFRPALSKSISSLLPSISAIAP